MCRRKFMSYRYSTSLSFQSVVRAAVTTVPYVFGSVPAFFALYNVCDEDCQHFSEMRQNASRSFAAASGEAITGGETRKEVFFYISYKKHA